MPPRQPALPEGTDQIVRGAAADGEDAGSATEKLVGQVREQVASLKSQAGARVRDAAGDGKARATDLLADFGDVIDEAARAVDRKFGEDYGDYAHRAASAVSSLADKVRAKTIDELIDDTREFVRKSPGIAIGIAAVAGFVLVRLIKTGLDDVSAGGRAANDGA